MPRPRPDVQPPESFAFNHPSTFSLSNRLHYRAFESFCDLYAAYLKLNPPTPPAPPPLNPLPVIPEPHPRLLSNRNTIARHLTRLSTLSLTISARISALQRHYATLPSTPTSARSDPHALSTLRRRVASACLASSGRISFTDPARTHHPPGSRHPGAVDPALHPHTTPYITFLCPAFTPTLTPNLTLGPYAFHLTLIPSTTLRDRQRPLCLELLDPSRRFADGSNWTNCYGGLRCTNPNNPYFHLRADAQCLGDANGTFIPLYVTNNQFLLLLDILTSVLDGYNPHDCFTRLSLFHIPSSRPISHSPSHTEGRDPLTPFNVPTPPRHLTFPPSDFWNTSLPVPSFIERVHQPLFPFPLTLTAPIPPIPALHSLFSYTARTRAYNGPAAYFPHSNLDVVSCLSVSPALFTAIALVQGGLKRPGPSGSLFPDSLSTRSIPFPPRPSGTYPSTHTFICRTCNSIRPLIDHSLASYHTCLSCTLTPTPGAVPPPPLTPTPVNVAVYAPPLSSVVAVTDPLYAQVAAAIRAATQEDDTIDEPDDDGHFVNDDEEDDDIF